MSKVYNFVDKGEEWFRNKLRKNVLKVTFTKIDGSTREMFCTLNAGILPGEVISVTGRTKASTPGLISVYDTEVGAWRSFWMDSVLEVERVEKLD